MNIPEPRIMTIQNARPWRQMGPTRACRYCGQYPDQGDKWSIVVTNGTEGALYKIIGNFCIHESCWHELIEGCETFEEVLYKIRDKSQPRATNQNKDDPRESEFVRQAVRNLGYIIEKETRNRIYFRARRTRNRLAPFFYEKRFKKLEFSGRANGLFDGFVLQGIFDRVQDEITRLKEVSEEQTVQV